MKNCIKKFLPVASVAIFSFVFFQSFNHKSFYEDSVKCRKTIASDYCVLVGHAFKPGCANNTSINDCTSKPIIIKE